jgi:hypothetical protein
MTATNGNPLIDRPRQTLDLNDVEKRLAGQSNAAPARQTQERAVPSKLENKSREELIDMYVNLESHAGRLANDYGTTRKLAEELMAYKRAVDLGQPHQEPEKREPVRVTSSELLEKPGETLERVIAERDSALEAKIEQRFAHLEAQSRANQFTAKHPDVQEVAESDEFKTWVASSKVRQAAANLAAATNDLNLADELLSEYKDTRKQHAAQGDHRKAEPAESPESRARRLAFESSGGAAARSTEERFSSAELIQLKINKPQVYQAMGDRITKAYLEGRVDP